MKVKKALFLSIICATLVACANNQDDPAPMARDAVGNISQKSSCQDVQRRMVANQANVNAGPAWERDNDMQELRNEYHENNCGELD